jgi:hypothetical protein
MSIKMMSALLVCLTLLLHGCLVRTLHPLLEADDILLESTLTGEWETPEKNERWIFTAIYGGDYELTIIKCDTG